MERPPPRRNHNNQHHNTHYYRRSQHRSSKPASGFNHLIKSRKDHAGIPMTGERHDCLICCQPSDVFGLSECRHPVCMECCIRMRVLGGSESCPQCRSPIALLYFVSAPKDWENFTIPTGEVAHDDAVKYNIRFTNDYTVQCYDSYMAHSCQICSKNGDKVEFPTFGALRHHTSQTHQFTFCPICIEHLNVLSKDRHAYSKNNLDKHMKGTNNEVSGEKGHPLCFFCPERFFDNDHLYRHLRKDHFFCQICENEGAQNIFYSKIEELYSHYRKKHHPCTEPDCQAMGIVFRTDVELGVHKAAEHGNASRNVNIDFQFSGRNLGNRIPRSGAQAEREFPSIRQERISVVPSEPPPPVNETPSRIVPSAQAQQQRIVRSGFQATSVQDFPSLASQPPSSNPMPNWRQEVIAARQPRQAQVPLQLSSGEQFPTLGGGTSTAASTSESFPNLGGKKSNKNPASSTVWGKKSTTQLFKSQPPQPKPKPQEEPQRRRFIPCPDIWPEGMRERAEAKQNGLPDPGPSEEEKNFLDPLFRLEAKKKEKRKAAKQKSKTVPVSALVNRENDETFVQPSKFDALTEVDESAKNSNKKNKAKKITYGLTDDNKIAATPAPTLSSVAASIGEKNSFASIASLESKPKENGTTPPKPEALPSGSNDFPALGAPTTTVSLTDLVRNMWSMGKAPQTNQATSTSNAAANSKPKTSSWSTGPPPGFE